MFFWQKNAKKMFSFRSRVIEKRKRKRKRKRKKKKKKKKKNEKKKGGMGGPAPRLLVVDAVMRHYESDIRERLRPGVHLEFAHSTDAIAIARSAHLAGCTVSVIDRVDASAADSSVFYDPARAAVVIDSRRNLRAVALEDTLRLFDLDGDGALSAPELATAIRVTSGGSAENAAKAAADAVASFGQSDRGSLDSVAFARYANSPASALGRDLPYGASTVAPATALEVRPSRIYRAGLGLFAATDIAARTIICEYTGAELTLVETAILTDFTYLMGGLGLTCHIDAREHPDVLARYINDGGDASAQNARFVKIPSRRRACVLAMLDIRKGEEIYASYGPLYWTNETARYAAPSVRDAQQTPYLTSSVVSTRPPVSNIVGN
jgi:hypothetical protein